MNRRWLSILVGFALLGVSCSRDPEVAKRKYLESGNRYFARGKYNEASIMYRTALKKDPRYGEAYYRLGLTALKQNNPAAAERALSRAFSLLKPGPERDDAVSKLSDIYLAALITDTRRDKSYETIYKDFLNRLEKGTFDRLRLEGFLAWRNGDLEEAIKCFEQARQKKPGDVNTELAYAQILIATNRWEQAEKIAKELIARDKAAAVAYDLLYREYLRRNRIEDAEQIRRLKSENNPEVIDYRLQLAAHYFTQNRRLEGERVLKAILDDPKTFPRGRERVGDFYLTFREFDKAIELYKGGLQGSSKEDRLNFQRKIADVLILQGKRDQALSLLDNEILKNNPNDPVALALRATLWLEAGNRSQMQQAISELETAVSKLPRNAVVRYNLGRAYWTKGDVELARAQFRAAADIQPDYLAPRLALIQINLTRGEFAQALQGADEAIRISPTNLAARSLRAAALQGLGKTDEARAQLLAVLKARPDSAEIKFRLGLLEISAKNYPAAEKVFRECISSNQGEVACQIGLAEVMAAQKQYDKAIALLTEQLQKHPERRELQLAVGNTAVLSERYDLAVKTFKQMIEKDPTSSDLHLRLAETYRRMGDVPNAIENFRKAKQLSPNDPNAAIWLALLLHQTGREAEAKAEYEQILRLQSDNAVALNNLAYLIAEQGGDLDVALTYAQRAKQKLPQVLEISDTLGWIYLKKGLRTNAVEIYRDIVAKDPKNPTYRYHLGMALHQQGNFPQAKQELETALKNNPSRDEEAKIRDLLRKIG